MKKNEFFKTVKTIVAKDGFTFSKHGKQQAVERNILRTDIRNAILKGRWDEFSKGERGDDQGNFVWIDGKQTFKIVVLLVDGSLVVVKTAMVKGKK